MNDYLTKPINWFFQFGDVQHTPHGPLILQDNGANVLAVAHLDTVSSRKQKKRAPRLSGNHIYTPQLDDRLGAYTLLKTLPERGILCDVLLTDGEESCQSTAQHFATDREYNWMFSFDRAGTDFVMYQYESDFATLLEDTGMRCNLGAYSDICELEHLGVTGFNIGIGYHLQHTDKCYADLRDTKRQVDRFCQFYMEHYDTKMTWYPSESFDYRSYDYGRQDWYDSTYFCSNCGSEWQMTYDDRALYCPYCRSDEVMILE